MPKTCPPFALEAPFGYKRVKVNDGAKGRPSLKIDPAIAPIVREVFESSLRRNGPKEICRNLNDRGITNRGTLTVFDANSLAIVSTIRDIGDVPGVVRAR